MSIPILTTNDYPGARVVRVLGTVAPQFAPAISSATSWAAFALCSVGSSQDTGK